MDPVTTYPPTSSAQRWAAGILTCLVLGVAAFCGYTLLMWPKPHEDRRITRDDAVARMNRDAHDYAGLVIGVARGGPVTEDRLGMYAIQPPDSVGPAKVVTHGGTSVVTFSVARPWDGPSTVDQVTACYSITLVGNRTAVRPGALREVAASACAPRRG